MAEEPRCAPLLASASFAVTGIERPMADERVPNRHVAFAERFASGRISRFNAYAALERAQLLKREAQQIRELFKRERDAEDSEPWSWQGLEVVPYTLVGLATCLEWHARSRLTDLYSYKPESIEANVLDGKVAPRVLAQMIKANVSIPQLLGASVTVGSTKEYLGVFDNLFSILGIGAKSADVIQPPVVEQIGLFGDPIREPRVRERLDELFATRHALVHEIGLDADTMRSHCEIWGPPQVIGMCYSVISVISKLEEALTAHAPADFPNLLTPQGYPVDERTRLARSISELENSIGAEIAARHSPGTGAMAGRACQRASIGGEPRSACRGQEAVRTALSWPREFPVGLEPASTSGAPDRDRVRAGEEPGRCQWLTDFVAKPRAGARSRPRRSPRESAARMEPCPKPPRSLWLLACVPPPFRQIVLPDRMRRA